MWLGGGAVTGSTRIAVSRSALGWPIRVNGEWDSNSPASFRFCKLQIPQCHGCRECQRCRGAFARHCPPRCASAVLGAPPHTRRSTVGGFGPCIDPSLHANSGVTGASPRLENTPGSAIFPSTGYAPDRLTDVAVANLAANQLSDGRWQIGGIARPPIEDGDIFRVALGIRALTVYGPPGRAGDLNERVTRSVGCGIYRDGRRNSASSTSGGSACPPARCSAGSQEPAEPTKRYPRGCRVLYAHGASMITPLEPGVAAGQR